MSKDHKVVIHIEADESGASGYFKGQAIDMTMALVGMMQEQEFVVEVIRNALTGYQLAAIKNQKIIENSYVSEADQATADFEALKEKK